MSIYKTIPGFSNYIMFRDSTIRNRKTGKQIKATGEYPKVTLYNQGKKKTLYISKLKREIFCEKITLLQKIKKLFTN